MEGKGSIREYFKGKNIFITGGTGFVGKALIEKLLRSCPDLNKIYVLVRPKKGKTLYERVHEMLSSPIFNLLKKELPENVNKIIPIAGDVRELQLGLSSDDREILKEQINIFFHTAASVRFDDFLKEAILTNLRAAREAAFLALEMKSLDVFLHVSTTYCNIDNRKTVDEILYPAHGDWRQIIAIAETVDSHLLNMLSQKFIGVFPNTYTYTKQLAEHCINDLLLGKVNTVIHRPSIVVGTLVDPYQGWVDNFNGPNGIIVAAGTGLVRILYTNPTVKSDYVPVDIVVKSMIVATWYKVTFGSKSNLDIYHASANANTKIEMQELMEIGKPFIWEAPLKHNVWFPGLKMTQCWYYYYVNVILFQVIPALFLDSVIKLAGYSPVIFKVQKKIYIATTSLEPFMMNEWNFLNSNTAELKNHIPRSEMHEFNYDLTPGSKKQIYEFFLSCGIHCKEHLLHEEKIITNELYSRNLRMYYLDRACYFTFYGFLLWLVFFKYNIVLYIWNIFCNYLNDL